MNFFKFLISKTFWIQVVLAIIVSVLLVFLMVKWLDVYTHHDETIEVPDLSRMQLEQVDKTLEALNLQEEILDSVGYNPDYPKHSVVEQNPKAGKRVKEGRKIYLKLNPSGFPKIEVPDFIRHTKRQVVPALGALGFKIGD